MSHLKLYSDIVFTASDHLYNGYRSSEGYHRDDFSMIMNTATIYFTDWLLEHFPGPISLRETLSASPLICSSYKYVLSGLSTLSVNISRAVSLLRSVAAVDNHASRLQNRVEVPAPFFKALQVTRHSDFKILCLCKKPLRLISYH